MPEIKVSVIMPCHNGEEYMEETLRQLLAQSLQDIEIICVDDESVDSTFRILKEYEEKDSRIHAFRQKKSNAGAARNLGMEKASGEYLLFLDSDDLFEPDLLEQMYEACRRDGAELCVCNADQYDVEKEIYMKRSQYLRKRLLPDKRPFSKEDIQKYILYFTTSVPWNKMVKADFLKEQGICFQDIERANDQYFSIMCLLSAERITVAEKRLVHYKVKQKTNLTTTYSETPLCSYYAMLAVKEELAKRKLFDIPYIRQAFDNKVINVLLYALNIQQHLPAYRQLYDVMKNEGLERLGVSLHDREYYFSELEYENLCNITRLTCEEYLLVRNHNYYEKVKTKNDIIQAGKEQIAKDSRELGELRKKEQELRELKNRKWYKPVMKIDKWYHRLFGKKQKNREND